MVMGDWRSVVWTNGNTTEGDVQHYQCDNGQFKVLISCGCQGLPLTINRRKYFGVKKWWNWPRVKTGIISRKLLNRFDCRNDKRVENTTMQNKRMEIFLSKDVAEQRNSYKVVVWYDMLMISMTNLIGSKSRSHQSSVSSSAKMEQWTAWRTLIASIGNSNYHRTICSLLKLMF